jgi:hypothetical protein
VAERAPSSAGPVDPGFAERVVRYLDDALAPDELDRLNQELLAEPGKRDAFVRLCTIESLAAEQFGPAAETPLGGEEDPFAAVVEWPAPADKPVDESPPPRHPLPLGSRIPVPRRRNAPTFSMRRWAAIAAALLLAAAGTWVVRSRLFESPNAPTPAPPQPVAMLAQSIGAQWGPGAKPDPAAPLTAGSQWQLNAGVARIRFNDGADVIVEGPATFTLNSPSALSLAAGRLFGTKQGGGFRVGTPTAAIIDLGTEFGVNVQPDGVTHVEVFAGRVRAASATTRAMAAGPSPPSQILAAGQAAVVTADTVKADAAGALPQHFVRTLTPATGPLDVVDLVAGGDGTSGRRDRGIDVLTGASGTPPQVRTVTGHHQYVRVAERPVVDGCFVPNSGGAGAGVGIDSAGDAFAFPPNNDRTFGLLWAGGLAPPPPSGGEADRGAVTSPDRAVLGGIDYSQNGHRFLSMHSNKGITLDLSAIRRLHPGAAPNRFRCVVGNTCPAAAHGTHFADAWVFVDGHVRFERRRFANDGHAIDIDLPLAPTDRFLTLVTTDGGDGIGYDWVIWADPLLDLAQAAPMPE